jgi:hypothetical protein
MISNINFYVVKTSFLGYYEKKGGKKCEELEKHFS